MIFLIGGFEPCFEHSAEESDYIIRKLGQEGNIKLGERYAWSPATADEFKWQSVPRETAKKIYKHYYLDFVLFGYSPNDVMKFINATDDSKPEATLEQEIASWRGMRFFQNNYKKCWTDFICKTSYFPPRTFDSLRYLAQCKWGDY